MSLCLSCVDASFDMQHYVLWSQWPWPWNWPKFWICQNHWKMICFKPPWQEAHDGVIVIFLSFLSKKLLTKQLLLKTDNFSIMTSHVRNRIEYRNFVNTQPCARCASNIVHRMMPIEQTSQKILAKYFGAKARGHPQGRFRPRCAVPGRAAGRC